MKKSKPSNSQLRFNILVLTLIKSRSRTGVAKEADVIEWGLRSNWLLRSERALGQCNSKSGFGRSVYGIVSRRFQRHNLIKKRYIEWCEFSSSFEITKKGTDFLVKFTEALAIRQSSEKADNEIDLNLIVKFLRTYVEKLESEDI